MPYPCFWTEPTGDANIYLRRFTYGDYPKGHEHHDGRSNHHPCPSQPVQESGYQSGHDYTSPLIRRTTIKLSDEGHIALIGAGEYRNSKKWRGVCKHCGGRFRGIRQVVQRPIYHNPHTGEEWVDRQLPPGALYHAKWYESWPKRYTPGPDGIILGCVLPHRDDLGIAGGWIVDGPATGGGHWTRTGDPTSNPPTVDVNPSIASRAGSPDYYHGFLRNGVLTDHIG